MKFFIITLFPQIFEKSLDFSILKRAKEKTIVNIVSVNLRDFTKDRRKTTDLPPYGGGAGMVLMPEPIFNATNHIFSKYKIKRRATKIILLSASGKLFDQNIAQKLSRYENIILICGHYEGVDERVAENLADIELSIGNYVLSGGESAVFPIIDAVVRLLPKVLKNEDSLKEESFNNGMLEYPQYTKPETLILKDGIKLRVPSVLLSGNHEKIKEWRRQESLKKMKANRPDLLRRKASLLHKAEGLR